MIKFHPVYTRDEIQADPGNAHACLPQWGAVKISDFYWVELRGKIPLQKLIFLNSIHYVFQSNIRFYFELLFCVKKSLAILSFSLF